MRLPDGFVRLPVLWWIDAIRARWWSCVRYPVAPRAPNRNWNDSSRRPSPKPSVVSNRPCDVSVGVVRSGSPLRCERADLAAARRHLLDRAVSHVDLPHADADVPVRALLQYVCGRGAHRIRSAVRRLVVGGPAAQVRSLAQAGLRPHSRAAWPHIVADGTQA